MSSEDAVEPMEIENEKDNVSISNEPCDVGDDKEIGKDEPVETTDNANENPTESSVAVDKAVSNDDAPNEPVAVDAKEGADESVPVGEKAASNVIDADEPKKDESNGETTQDTESATNIEKGVKKSPNITSSPRKSYVRSRKSIYSTPRPDNQDSQDSLDGSFKSTRLLEDPIDKEIDCSDYVMSWDEPPIKKQYKQRVGSGVDIYSKADVDEKYLLPFKLGWRREIVIRNSGEASVPLGFRQADTYYYAPCSKKLRSIKEIGEFLQKKRETELTMDNFTMLKRVIYKTPEEIVRAAGATGRKSTGSPKPNPKPKPKPNILKLKKVHTGDLTANLGSKIIYKISESAVNAFYKNKVTDKYWPVSKEKKKVFVAKKRTAPRYGAGLDNILTNAAMTSEQENMGSIQKLCSLNCVGREGITPSLQCSSCLCLYHPYCAGLSGNPLSIFICKACTKTETTTNRTNMPTLIKSPAINNGNLVDSNGKTKSLPPPLTPATQNSKVWTDISSPKGTDVTRIRISPNESPVVKALPPSMITSSSPKEPITGQLLTLPSSVLSKVNPMRPLTLRINDQRLLIPPNCFIISNDGVKVFLPPGTLPSSSPNKVSSAVNMQLNVNSETLEQGLRLLANDKRNSESRVSNLDSQSNIAETVESVQGDTTSNQLAQHSETSECFITKLHNETKCMGHIFTFLPLKDLLRAKQVCTFWKKVACLKDLWKYIGLRHICISNWEAAAKCIEDNNTQTLDMRGMQFYEDKNRTWHQISSVLDKLKNLQRLYLGLAPGTILHSIAEKMTNLEVLTADQIVDNNRAEVSSMVTSTKLDISKFSQLKNLKELKVRSPNGLSLPNTGCESLSQLSSLQHLKVLSMTTLRKVPGEDFIFLSSLKNLERLELGDCIKFGKEVYTAIAELSNLKRLRLENGLGENQSIVADALEHLTRLESLDLIRFYIGKNMEKAMKNLSNLHKFTVWPVGGSKAATVNTNTLKAALSLTSLQHLDWGITLEESSALILDENESDNAKQKQGEKAMTECIAFDSNTSVEDNVELNTETDSPPEYTSIGQLVDRLRLHLPDTRIRVFRVPMTDTSKLV